MSTTAHNSLAHHLTCEVLKASRHTITTPEYSRWIMTTSLDSFRYSQVILTEASKPKHGIRCSSCSEVLIFVKRSRQRCFIRIQSVRADRCITETFGFTLSTSRPRCWKRLQLLIENTKNNSPNFQTVETLCDVCFQFAAYFIATAATRRHVIYLSMWVCCTRSPSVH